jgi:hypothetical protein
LQIILTTAAPRVDCERQLIKKPAAVVGVVPIDRIVPLILENNITGMQVAMSE